MAPAASLSGLVGSGTSGCSGNQPSASSSGSSLDGCPASDARERCGGGAARRAGRPRGQAGHVDVVARARPCPGGSSPRAAVRARCRGPVTHRRLVLRDEVAPRPRGGPPSSASACTAAAWRDRAPRELGLDRRRAAAARRPGAAASCRAAVRCVGSSTSRRRRRTTKPAWQTWSRHRREAGGVAVQRAGHQVVPVVGGEVELADPGRGVRPGTAHRRGRLADRDDLVGVGEELQPQLRIGQERVHQVGGLVLLQRRVARAPVPGLGWASATRARRASRGAPWPAGCGSGQGGPGAREPVTRCSLRRGCSWARRRRPRR